MTPAGPTTSSRPALSDAHTAAGTASDPSLPTILFAGGGSGGHIAPGLAIIESLRARGSKARCIFACSQRAIDATMLREAGIEFFPLPATPPGRSIEAILSFLWTYRRSRQEAGTIIERENVTQVVCLGGFIAAPVASAAHKRSISTLLVNLDSPPGRANRWMARHCTRRITAVDLPEARSFASEFTGMPIRACAVAPADRHTCKVRLGFDPDKPLLLVTGASQGATSINKFLLEIVHHQPAWLDGWQIYHIAGEGQVELVRRTYASSKTTARVDVFQPQMGLAWGAADLAISRSGASSVAEVVRNAVPTIFMPYPYHRDQHQTKHAQKLVDLGAAVLLPDQIGPVANLLTNGNRLHALLQDTASREKLAAALRSIAMPDGGAKIADILLNAEAQRLASVRSQSDSTAPQDLHKQRAA